MNGIIDKCVAAGFERTLVTRWFTPGPRVFFGITSYGDLYTTFPQEKDTTPQAVLNHLKTLMNNVPTEIVRGLCLHPKNMVNICIRCLFLEDIVIFLYLFVGRTNAWPSLATRRNNNGGRKSVVYLCRERKVCRW